jgi:hypothetical protein
MKKNKIPYLFLILLSSQGHAGFHKATYHSRANCLNNESISWDYTLAHNYATVSFHTPDYANHSLPTHRIESGWEFTKRSAAICWLEGKALPRPDWYYVAGYHWEVVGKAAILQMQTGTDWCSVDDGWFKKNKE